MSFGDGKKIYLVCTKSEIKTVHLVPPGTFITGPYGIPITCNVDGAKACRLRELGMKIR
jgi:hypothetical protein